ncbi:hypothetical protein [Citrobacter braakii]|uniref:hypothetical protein n=1 Tax=Citrobacter braakii TaxID=57706 RepID=UPI002DBF41CD|nr:hypothetical protein [Citrobacter braakii]MEB8014797.1 hypothetical protein [Citrobacter braakii]
MKPATHVFLWLSELLALTVVYTLLCYFIPDEAFMAWYEENYGCCGQLKLATALEFFQYRFSDSFGGNPPLYSCGLSAL